MSEFDDLDTSVPGGYERLQDVLARAYVQAAQGKGRERHAREGVPFEGQPIVQLGLLMGRSTIFNIGQAGKKSLESLRLDREAAVRELLGAIVYLAGAVVILEGAVGAAGGDEGSMPYPSSAVIRLIESCAIAGAADATGDVDAARVAWSRVADLGQQILAGSA